MKQSSNLSFLALIFLVNFSLNAQNIFDFSNNLTLKNWNIVNDDVMGGVSSSSLTINNSGHT